MPLRALVTAALSLLVALAGSPAPAGGAALEVEARRLVARLVDGDGVRRIAILHRDGPVGREGRDAVGAALAGHGMGVVALATLSGGEAGLARALARIRPAAPEAIILAGPPGGADGPACDGPAAGPAPAVCLLPLPQMAGTGAARP